MTPDRWQHVAEIYAVAVDQEPATRERFLAEACAGDESLRLEVEALLREDVAPTILDAPVWSTAAPLFASDVNLTPGTTLGPYRIEQPVGAGGMGEVFRGLDTRLARPVAIKVLSHGMASSDAARLRFAREARAVASLAHPHICTLYDVGCEGELDYLVMEYLEGHTLAAELKSGPLPLEVALRYAIELADALEHAHRHGVVHRDLKPANIMLSMNRAKLLDFGLAKLRGLMSGGDQIVSGSAPDDGSHAGVVLGTIRYMAPEQIEGQTVDARTDIFSFGAVLYEMLTGARAFDGEDAASIRVGIIARDPTPVRSLRPQVPTVVANIVGRCLARAPGDRWQTAAEIVRELTHAAEAHRRSTSTAGTRVRRWAIGVGFAAVTAGAVWVTSLDDQSRESRVLSDPGIQSIAILPVDTLSNNQEYLAEGLTEQLITEVARGGMLRVISLSSALTYRNVRRSVPVIARELNVEAVIQCSILEANDRLHITARLVSGATGHVVWVERFERAPRDALASQREIARAIAARVRGATTSQQAAHSVPTPVRDPELYRQVLLGRHQMAKSTEEGLRRAIGHFEAAIARDASHAPAHAGLADAYLGLSGYYEPPRAVMPKAKRAAEAAIRLDESLADAHAALGFVHLVYDWNGVAAERALRRALELNPSLADARLNYAAYLTSQGRLDDAVREIRTAVELDPQSIRTHAFGTLFLLFARRYEEAIELARRSLEFEPESAFTLAFQGAGYAELGRFPEALANLERAAQLDRSPTIRALQAHVMAVAGQTQAARSLIRQIEKETQNAYFCPYEIATAYVSLGEPDTAVRWLRKGIEDRADCMPWLGVEPWMDRFRSDHRYATLLRQIGLTPAH